MGYLIGLAQLAGRSGCPEWDFVLTRGGVHRGCDTGSDFSGSSSQWVRYRQRRRGICTHTVVTGSRIPLNRPGLVLAGVLASGTPTEILSPACDVVEFPQSVVFCANAGPDSQIETREPRRTQFGAIFFPCEHSESSGFTGEKNQIIAVVISTRFKRGQTISWKPFTISYNGSSLYLSLAASMPQPQFSIVSQCRSFENDLSSDVLISVKSG